MLEPRSGQTVVIADLCPACESGRCRGCGEGGGADNAFLARNTTTTAAGMASNQLWAVPGAGSDASKPTKKSGEVLLDLEWFAE